MSTCLLDNFVVLRLPFRAYHVTIFKALFSTTKESIQIRINNVVWKIHSICFDNM